MQQDRSLAEPVAGEAAERTVYTGCICNCGSNFHCVIKAHIQNGVVTRVEPDDR